MFLKSFFKSNDFFIFNNVFICLFEREEATLSRYIPPSSVELSVELRVSVFSDSFVWLVALPRSVVVVWVQQLARCGLTQIGTRPSELASTVSFLPPNSTPSRSRRNVSLSARTCRDRKALVEKSSLRATLSSIIFESPSSFTRSATSTSNFCRTLNMFRMFEISSSRITFVYSKFMSFIRSSGFARFSIFAFYFIFVVLTFEYFIS